MNVWANILTAPGDMDLTNGGSCRSLSGDVTDASALIRLAGSGFLPCNKVLSCKICVSACLPLQPSRRAPRAGADRLHVPSRPLIISSSSANHSALSRVLIAAAAANAPNYFSSPSSSRSPARTDLTEIHQNDMSTADMTAGLHSTQPAAARRPAACRLTISKPGLLCFVLITCA